MSMMTVVTTDGNKIEFETYEAYFEWDAERAKEERRKKEESERREAEERAKKLASLTESQKEEVDKLEEEIFLIKVSSDFLSQKDYEDISNNRRKIREIRGF